MLGVIATAVVAAAFSCRPQPGLGSIVLARGGALHLIDMANCSERVLVPRGVEAPVRFVDGGTAVEYGNHWVVSASSGKPRIAQAAAGTLASSDGRFSAMVRSTGPGQTASETIWVTSRRAGSSRAIYSLSETPAALNSGTAGPIWLLGWSRDDRWVFFTVDPDSSASIAADGLLLRAVSASPSGGAHRVAFMLAYPDYMSWCGGQLVMSAGGDRIATDRKRLLVATPQGWHTRTLVRAPGRSWGALACAPDEHYLVAQAQPSSVNADFFSTRWALWKVNLNGATRKLTTPPGGYADESPLFSRDGRSLLFVRSRKGVGKLYLLRGEKLVGPLLSLGYQLGYFGRQDWWQTAAWSNAEPG